MATQTESPKTATMAEKVFALRAKRAELELGGGEDRIEKQHDSGKLSARERVAKLVDKESFEEIGLYARHRATYFGMAEKELPADGVVTGCATIDGRLVHLASQDFTVAGGAAGETHSNKVAEMMGMSLKTGSPFIFINDSGRGTCAGGHRQSGRLCPSFLQQCDALRHSAPDLPDLRPMRGRRGLQPSAH